MIRDSGFVLVDNPQPHVALVTLNRPERMNSMAFDVMMPLKEVLTELSYDNSVRVVVLTGAGRGFSSGADHKSAGRGTSAPNARTSLGSNVDPFRSTVTTSA